MVVADDQPVICAGFAALLDAQGDLEVVGTAANGAELVALVEEMSPDVALVDVRMPVMDGIEATRRISATSGTRVLVLTTFDLDEYVFDALRAGASGFLLKDVTAERLVDAVRLVAEGSMLLGPGVTRRLVADFAAHASVATRPPAYRLTARESEVLVLLGGGARTPRSPRPGRRQETVKTHVPTSCASSRCATGCRRSCSPMSTGSWVGPDLDPLVFALSGPLGVPSGNA